MKELDESKIYDLSLLNNNELNYVLEYAQQNNPNHSCKKTLSWLKSYTEQGYKFYYSQETGWRFARHTDNYINAKELFYTLENIQVDCTNETDERIKEMADVFNKSGFNVDYSELHLETGFNFLSFAKNVNESYVMNFDKNKTTITYEKFMELFGNKEKSEEFNNLVGVLNEELTEEAYKETDNKLNYELDFNFITQLAERMAQNKHKYEPYNWRKLDNISELKQALFRHVLEVMKGNYEDDNRLLGHLESIALNAMFINYQLNNLNNK